jgi:hypothetical protein
MKDELKTDQKMEAYLCDNINTSNVKKDFYNKNVSVIDEISIEQNIPLEALAKRELLQRYLNDSIQNNDTYRSECNDMYLPVRTSGVGCENISDFETELPERTRGDGEESINSDLDSGNVHDMNVAFIVNRSRKEHALFTRNDKLNEGILYDTDVTEDEESAFDDNSDCYDSICELERNICESYAEDTYIKLNELKRIHVLSKDKLNARITEDDLLDSFMNTFVHNEESDEGRGSVNSDFE